MDERDAAGGTACSMGLCPRVDRDVEVARICARSWR